MKLTEGHKVRKKQNQLSSFSLTFLSWSLWNLMLCWSSSSWLSWYYCEIYLIIGNSCCFARKETPTAILTFARFQTNLPQAWYDDKCLWNLHFDTTMSDLDLVSSSQGCKKAKTLVPIIPQRFKWILMELSIVQRRADLKNFMLMSFHLITIQRKETYYGGFIQNKQKEVTTPPS